MGSNFSTLETGRQSQEDWHKFEPSLVYTVSPRPVEAIKVILSQRKGKRNGKKNEEKGRVGQAVQEKGGADKIKMYRAIGDREGWGMVGRQLPDRHE